MAFGAPSTGAAILSDDDLDNISQAPSRPVSKVRGRITEVRIWHPSEESKTPVRSAFGSAPARARKQSPYQTAKIALPSGGTWSIWANGDLDLIRGSVVELEGYMKAHPVYGESLQAYGQRDIKETFRTPEHHKTCLSVYLSQELGIEAMAAYGIAERVFAIAPESRYDMAVFGSVWVDDQEYRLMDMIADVVRGKDLQVVSDRYQSLYAETTLGATDPMGEAVNPVSSGIVQRVLAASLSYLEIPSDTLAALARAAYKQVMQDAPGVVIDLTQASDIRQLAARMMSVVIKNPFQLAAEVQINPLRAMEAALAIDGTYNTGASSEAKRAALFVTAIESSCKDSTACLDARAAVARITLAHDAEAVVLAGQAMVSDQLERDDVNTVKPVYKETVMGKVYYAPMALAEKEHRLAEILVAAVGRTTPLWSGSEDELTRSIAHFEAMAQIQLDASQRAAIVGILTEPTQLHVLTGGPGTGKSTIMRIVVDVLSANTAIRAVAPTGKAAKVLDSKVNQDRDEKITITTLDKYFSNPEPEHTELLSVDESSMLCVEKGMATFSKFSIDNQTGHIILIGDQNQLESVGAGAVLRDLLNRTYVAHHSLATTHRNKGGLYRFIAAVGEGRWEVPKESDKVVVLMGDKPSATKVVDQYMALIKDGVAKEDILAVVPYRTSTRALNLNAINDAIQSMLNPRGMRIPGTIDKVQLGDRVRITSTLKLAYDMDVTESESDGNENRKRAGPHLNVVPNGEMGTFTDFVEHDSAGPYAVFEADDGKAYRVRTRTGDIAKVVRAYATTVHSSQGSEAKFVLMAFSDETDDSAKTSDFLTRNMVFTAASRTSDVIYIAGNEDIYRKIVARDNRNSRVTLLGDLMDTYMAAQLHQRHQVEKEPMPDYDVAPA